MPYSAEISRSNPTCFIILIDQSGSMADGFGGSEGLRKSDFVADVVNKTLHDLVIRCTKAEEIRNYYYISITGYGGTVQSAFSGALAGKTLVPIGEVADNPARLDTRMKKVPDGAGGLVEQQVRFPTWIDPGASGGTRCARLCLRQNRFLNNGFPNTRTVSLPLFCISPTVNLPMVTRRLLGRNCYLSGLPTARCSSSTATFHRSVLPRWNIRRKLRAYRTTLLRPCSGFLALCLSHSEKPPSRRVLE